MKVKKYDEFTYENLNIHKNIEELNIETNKPKLFVDRDFLIKTSGNVGLDLTKNLAKIIYV